jgi:hypothetical protein
MKIRLIGSADLVRAWSAELERAYGLKGSVYPSRYNKNELRVYFDMDDRQAANLMGVSAGAEPPKSSKSALPRLKPRA